MCTSPTPPPLYFISLLSQFHTSILWPCSTWHKLTASLLVQDIGPAVRPGLMEIGLFCMMLSEFSLTLSPPVLCLCLFVPISVISDPHPAPTSPLQDSRRERSSNFQSFVRMALETLLGSCRRKRGIHHTPTEHVQPSKTLMSWHRHSLPVRPFLLVRADRGVRVWER